jgi:hypothetical protein
VWGAVQRLLLLDEALKRHVVDEGALRGRLGPAHFLADITHGTNRLAVKSSDKQRFKSPAKKTRATAACGGSS